MSTLFSIITINKNNSIGLAKTIESVSNQKLDDYQYIIIDGCSTDGSLNVIQSCNLKQLAYIYENDNGIYNAMNKGISVATGMFIIFMNSGDTFYSNDTLMHYKSFIIQFPQYDIYYGNYLSNGKISFIPQQLSLFYFRINSLCHQSSVIRRSLFTDFGFYDENYKIVSDHIFFLKMYLSKKKFIHIGETTSVYDTSGISTTYETGVETKKAWAEIVPFYLRMFIYPLYTIHVIKWELAHGNSIFRILNKKLKCYFL